MFGLAEEGNRKNVDKEAASAHQDLRTRPASLIHPGVNEPDAATFKIGSVARRKSSFIRMCNGCNLRVKERAWPTPQAAISSQRRESSCGALIKRKNSIGK